MKQLKRGQESFTSDKHFLGLSINYTTLTHTHLHRITHTHLKFLHFTPFLTVQRFLAILKIQAFELFVIVQNRTYLSEIKSNKV